MAQQRGRSPSAGHQQLHINNHSPSPHSFQDDGSRGLGLPDQIQGNGQTFLSNGFNPNTAFPNTDFMNQQTQSFSQGGLGEANYASTTGITPQFKQEGQSSPYSQPQLGTFTQDLMNATSGFGDAGDFALFPAVNSAEYDPSFFSGDPAPASRNGSVNLSQIDMSSPHNTSTPPGNLFQPDARSPGSAHKPSSFDASQFPSSSKHTRNASLGPESAAFPHGQIMEWGIMRPQFTGHRRTPSEYSDVSVSSVQHSPNLGHHDSFDQVDPRHSPMQQAQDSIYENVLGIGSFSLSDTQIQHPASSGQGLSPAHSPSMSPRLSPQQVHVMGQQNTMYSMDSNGYVQSNVYNQNQQEAFPQLHNEMGQSQQMVPDINVEFAPASRQNSFEPPKPSLDQDALTPPERGMPIPQIQVILIDGFRSSASSIYRPKQ